MKKYNNFQIGMFGVQGLAIALLCYVLGPGLAGKSNDPVFIARLFFGTTILAAGCGVALLLVAFFRKK